MTSWIDIPDPIMFCKDALTYIHLDLEILDFLQILTRPPASEPEAKFWGSHLHVLMEDFQPGEAEYDKISTGNLSRILQGFINTDLEFLLHLVRLSYQKAADTNPLGCRRLASTICTMYTTLQHEGKPIHPIRHSIYATVNEKC